MSTNWVDNLFSSPSGGSGPAAVDAYGKNVASAAAFGASGMGDAGLKMTNSYLNEYQPYDRKLMSHVDNLGTDSYRSAQRGKAMTDVGIQMGNAQQAMNRNMARMGVDPTSGAAARMGGQLMMQGALGKVQAASAADAAARDEYVKGLGAVNQMGIRTGELGLKSAAMGGDLAKVGLMGADLGAAAYDRNTQAQASMTSAGAAAQNASTNAAKVAQDAAQFAQSLELDRTKLAQQNEQFGKTNDLALGRLDWDKQYGMGNLAVNRYQIDTNKGLREQEIATAAKAGSLPNMIGSTAAAVGTRYVLDALGNWVKTGFSNPSSVSEAPGFGQFGSALPPPINIGKGNIWE